VPALQTGGGLARVTQILSVRPPRYTSPVHSREQALSWAYAFWAASPMVCCFAVVT